MRGTELKLLSYCGCVLLLGCLLAAGCSPGIAPERTVTVAPQRVISLAPSLTEMVYELGEDTRLVGVTDYCTAYHARETKERVGTLLQPNAEKIIALRPDRILANNTTNRARTLEQLRGVGLHIEEFGLDTGWVSIREKYLRLGKLLGVTERAAAQVAEVDRAIDRTHAAVAPFPRVRVLCQVGTDPLVAVGSGSFLNELISDAGGENLTAGNAEAYPRYSREEALRLNPDLILMVDMGNMSPAEAERWRQVPSLAAVRANRLPLLRAQEICIPTPQHYAASVRLLAKLFHPAAVLP